MRMIYENDYRGTSTFGKLLYKYSLDHPGAAAVRCRKIMIPLYLRDVCEKQSGHSGDEIKFMSIACGPAYELSHVFISPEDAARYQCTLLDQDREALKEAEDNIISIEKNLGSRLKVRYIEDSVRTMLRTPDLSANWGRFHFIYSMGLFDYLIPTVAKAVIEKIYDLLLPGGELLIGNYHHGNRSKWFMEYWHDWVLYYRSEDEFIELLADTDAVGISVKFDDTGSQMFLSAKKPLKADEKNGI
jgi:extracellular factor (EF) 3-hydroxypalmitic acid methyl ester biosynthesis protein